jgi:endoglucanase
VEFLRTEGPHVVDSQGRRVRLRGTCVGGWMNLEDFIDGYSGAEHTLRLEMAAVLGASRAHFFFERLLHHFFNEDDVVYLKRLGASVVRLPLNYRHFEDDQAPFVYREDGFARLDAALAACERHGLYAILDLHAVQGWQNVHWHADNASRISLFWHDAHYQDRFVALWREIARRCRGRAVVAGYNLMNEPCVGVQRGDLPWNIHRHYSPDWPRINAIYRRAVTALREVDPDHIVFLEGDRYSTEFAGLDAPFADHLVYSSHNYNAAGFGPGAYPGAVRAPAASPGGGTEVWDAARQDDVFAGHAGTAYTRRHGVPLWIGEFGAVYNGPAAEVPDRLRALDDQIGTFERHGAHWTTWTYKDVGVMGLVTLDPGCEYLQRVGRFIDTKVALGTDHWMQWMPPTPVKDAAARLARQIDDAIGDPTLDAHFGEACFTQAALCSYAGALMQRTYAGLFKGASENEIDRVLASFSLAQCRVNRPLEAIVAKYAALPA